MGKQTNAQVLRFSKSEDWLFKYYSDSFNYGNFVIQDNLIRDYVINVISRFNTKVAQVYIYREKYKIIIRVFSYNDSFTNWNSYLVKQRKKQTYKYNCLDYFSRKHEDIFNSSSYDSGTYNFFDLNSYLSPEIIFSKNGKILDFIYVQEYSKKFRRLTGYSGKRLLALNLSYLLKTNVIIKNTNIIDTKHHNLLLKIFRPVGFRLRSPLSKYLRVKFVCLVYYSLIYKSSLLLCRYLRFIVPRFCKKKRKGRKINPFLRSLSSLLSLMFLHGWIQNAAIKGIKILFKGRINGSRRKRTYVIKKGRTSTQSFTNLISYHQEDCLTIFGVLGIKVWIIY